MIGLELGELEARVPELIGKDWEEAEEAKPSRAMKAPRTRCKALECMGGWW
jgi:hypothetical protein